MIYFCSQRNRRAKVLDSPNLNGIDYLEILDGTGDQRMLAVTLLKTAGAALQPAQVTIAGGESVTGIKVLSVQPAAKATPKTIVVQVDKAGDFSTYTLSLVRNQTTTEPPAGFDPQLASVDFSFKAGCPVTTDCNATACCPAVDRPEPEINYLAKDFLGFQQVMLDRMAVLMPGWTERHAADLGVALVEILAYVADHLSYRQDAVATEAYLGTARSRISLRRHARLVDYTMGEGTNARAWIQLKVGSDGMLPKGSQVFPRIVGQPALIKPGSANLDALLRTSAVVFETMADTKVYAGYEELHFYTWSDANCCLPRGAVQATLAGHLDKLAVGDVLLFEEVLGPHTGATQDADPMHRCAVRLTAVSVKDSLGQVLIDPLTNAQITQIAWAAADALPFSLCVSATTDAAHGSRAISDVSVARANMVPADHGLSRDWETLGTVPSSPPTPIARFACGGFPPVVTPRPFFFPSLQAGPLTFAPAYDPTQPTSAFATAPAATTPPGPTIAVRDDSGVAWTNSADLLELDDLTPGFVVEIERDGTAFLRFGDGQYGVAPATGRSLQARYRTGNGPLGNVGADTLAHVLPNVPASSPPNAIPAIMAARNPLAGAGGTAADTMDIVRQLAPWRFRTQDRAVTEDDYGAMATRDPDVHAARGTLRWTGSWRTAFVTVQPAAAAPPDAQVFKDVRTNLDIMRMAGVDLEVEPAIIVGLKIALKVCLKGGYFRSDVQRALMDRFTSGTMHNGKPGLFNPANFSFGQTIYLSPFVAAAQSVDGVAAVQAVAFQRADDPASDATAAGFMTMHPLEIARLDNDLGRPDRGLFVLDLDDGQ